MNPPQSPGLGQPIPAYLPRYTVALGQKHHRHLGWIGAGTWTGTEEEQIAAQVGLYCSAIGTLQGTRGLRAAGVLPHVKGKVPRYVGTFVPQYPVPGGSMIETAEGEVPVLITQTRATPGTERSPSGPAGPVQAVRAITAKHIHQFAQPFWGRISTQSLSCPVLPVSCRVESVLPMSTRENGDHTVSPRPNTHAASGHLGRVLCALRACAPRCSA